VTKIDTVRTKKDIVRKISERANLPQVKTKEIVQWTFDAIIDVLIHEGRIELRNFGVFEVKTRRPRKARNPKTEEAVDVPAKNVVTFQPGKKMEAQVAELPKVYLPKPKLTKAKAEAQTEAKAKKAPKKSAVKKSNPAKETQSPPPPPPPTREPEPIPVLAGALPSTDRSLENPSEKTV
jgi:nucleoid DNA-binding protein